MRKRRLRLSSDLKDVVRESEQFLAAVAGEKAEAVRQQLTDLAASAREACGKLEEKAKDGLKTADESIGIALALGIVLGVVLSKK